MSGEYKTRKKRSEGAFDQLRRIAEEELKPWYEAMKYQKKEKRTDNNDNAFDQLRRIAKEDLKGIEKLINERKKR